MMRALWLFSMLSLALPAAADHDFAYCTACHGAHGNGNYAIRAPKIAGMEPWSIRRQLEAFRTNRRGAHPEDTSGQEMRPVGIRVHEEADIARAVAYVATFVPRKPPATLDGNVDRGRTLFATCATCHGQQGQGNESLGAPALAARSDWYLLTQLKNFSRGIRGADSQDVYGAQMRAAVATLSNDQDMQDVIAFINMLP